MTTTHDALARARTVQGLPLCPKWSNLFNLDITVADPAAGLGGKKHEIYAAAFDGHLFYDLFLQPPPLWIRHCLTSQVTLPGHVQTCSLGSTDGWQPTGMLSCYFFHSLDSTAIFLMTYFYSRPPLWIRHCLTSQGTLPWTCSNLFIGKYGRLATYWNAFLLLFSFPRLVHKDR